jgi:ATPase subunit of ABC transporter with duplicated ATPase domains
LLDPRARAERGFRVADRERPRRLFAQAATPTPERTARERVWSAVPRLDDLRCRIEGGSYELIADYAALGGYEMERRIDAIAGNLGLLPALDRREGDLSPGSRRKVELLAILIAEADLLLLDESVDLAVQTSDRLALIGENGSGKSTLLELLTGALCADRGESYRAPGVSTSYLRQGLRDFFQQAIVLNNFRDLPYEESEIRQYLGAARLRRERVFAPVAALSPGDAMRAALVKLVPVCEGVLVLERGRLRRL